MMLGVGVSPSEFKFPDGAPGEASALRQVLTEQYVRVLSLTDRW